jgi:hypothetical protein
MYTIYSFVAHHNMPTIVSKFDPELLVGWITLIGSLEAASKTTSSGMREMTPWILETDFCKIQYCLLLFPDVTMCKNCNTESTVWCCCNSV